MSSQARQKFDENSLDIRQLWEIHKNFAGKGPGRKVGVEVLNRAAIVFISACWESYVEDVAREAFGRLASSATTPDVISNSVKVLAAKQLREDRDERRIWELADIGWRKVLNDYSEEILGKWLHGFNTPKSKQVRELFQNLLGIDNILLTWCWQAMSSDRACKKLDKYITIRGNIVHRTKHESTVYKDSGADFLNHVTYLVQFTDRELFTHVK